MNTWDNLADAGLDASLIPQVGDIFSSLSNDDAGVFGADESAKSEGVVGRGRGRAGVGWGGCKKKVSGRGAGGRAHGPFSCLEESEGMVRERERGRKREVGGGNKI
jgi:hypothetical protein